MNQPDTPRSRKRFPWVSAAKNLFFYALVPFAVLKLLAQPIRNAVTLSGSAAFPILLAALAAVCLNWFVYTKIRRKHPPLPVFCHGILCLLAVLFIEYGALPGYAATASALALIAGFLTLLLLYLSAFGLAARNTKLTRVIAVGLRIAAGVILFFMAYQIVRDMEVKNVTRDTWITLAILIAAVLVRFSPRILSAVRRKKAETRAAGRAEGRIAQIVGESYLDRDEDLATRYYARVAYSVDDVPYEIRAGITRYAIRKFGRSAFTGRSVSVRYNPADPAEAFTDRINRRFFDKQKKDPDNDPEP